MKYIGSTLVLSILCSILSLLQAQVTEEVNDNPRSAKEYEELYQSNIRKSRINGVYIPKDLDEAFAELDALSSEEAKSKFKNAEEDIIARKLHFGLGRWIYVYWNLNEGSRYVEYLRNLGLANLDHMIQFTIVSYHRYKNNKPLEIDKQVDYFKEETEKARQELLKKREIISTTTRDIKKDGN